MVPVPPLRTGELLLVALAAVVVAAYGFVLHEQLSAPPWLAKPDPIWKEASDALGMALTPSAAIAHGQPFLTLGRPLVCMLAIACGFLVGRDGDRARQLMKAIAWSGAAYACYGILAHLFDPSHILALTQGGLSQFGHRNFHQPQYGGDLFRFVRGGVVGSLVGPHAARDEGAADQVAGDADGRAGGATASNRRRVRHADAVLIGAVHDRLACRRDPVTARAHYCLCDVLSP